MYADSLDELHGMARRLKLKREWFQNKDKLPHYDLVSSKRLLAVAYGAMEHSREEMVQFLRARNPSPDQAVLFG